MDLPSALVGLATGLCIGFVGHILAVRRSRHEHAVQEETTKWERCAEIASARIAYIVAHHSRAPNTRELREEHRRLVRRYPWADPEEALKDAPEWQAYHAAEVAARRDKSRSVKERIKAVEQAGHVLSKAIGARRQAARKRL